MGEIRLGEIGSFLHLRCEKVMAPLLLGTEVLFIGHSPPPAAQWAATSSKKRNSTISQLANFLNGSELRPGLECMGLNRLMSDDGPQAIRMHLMNLTCVVAKGNRPRGDSQFRKYPDYQAEMAAAEAANRMALSGAIHSGGFDLILIGWGKDTKSLALSEREALGMLEDWALGRTMLVCGSEEKGGWNIRHPGAGRVGDGTWTPYPAQPLEDYLRRSGISKKQSGVVKPAGMLVDEVFEPADVDLGPCCKLI